MTAARIGDSATAIALVVSGAALAGLGAVEALASPADDVQTTLGTSAFIGGAATMGISLIALKAAPGTNRTSRAFDRVLHEVDSRANWMLGHSGLPQADAEWWEVSNQKLQDAFNGANDYLNESIIAMNKSAEGQITGPDAYTFAANTAMKAFENTPDPKTFSL